MTGTDGRSEFFTREAAEYLDGLEALTAGAESPAGAEFVRLARSLRGAAMLAGPPAYTRAASQLEQVAKLVRDGTLPWGAASDPVQAALTDFRELLAAARAWDESRDTEAGKLARRLLDLAETATEPAAAVEPGEPTPGAGLRSFVARETAALAATIEAAVRKIDEAAGPAPEAFDAIREAMQSLRGLAGLSDLAPLPDLLDALDTAASDLRQLPVLPEGTTRTLATVTAAIVRIGRELVEAGHCRDDMPEVAACTEALYQTLVYPPGITPVESLLDPAAGAPAASPRPMADALESSAIGDRLRQGAAQLRGAASIEAARLQGIVLLAAIRNAPGGLGHRPAGPLLSAVALAIESGILARDPAGMASVLDRAGDLLSAASPGDAGREASLAELAAQLGGPAGEDVVPVESLLAGDEEEVVPVETLLATEEAEIVPIETLLATEGDEIVPIETLLAAEPPTYPAEQSAIVPIEDLLEPDGRVVPIETLLVAAAAKVGPFAPPGRTTVAEPPPRSVLPPAVPADRTMLERSLTTYSVLVRTNAPVVPLQQLAGPAVAPDRSRWSRSAALEIEAELDAIPVEDLVYYGQAAFARAEQVRLDLEIALRQASDELDRVEPLVRELLDLVPLALVDKR
jgi:HPt (histidine-containing phosphotransfer) domain-containing protein